MKFHKKAEAMLGIILIIVLVIGGLAYLVNLSQRECRSDKQCGSGSYCGSDFQCHEHRVVEKNVVQYNLMTPAIIIGIAIIVGAIILRRRPSTEPNTSNESKDEEVDESIISEIPDDDSEPIYEAHDEVKVP